MKRPLCDIVGMDITGDHSPVSVNGVFKSVVSRLNHPKKTAASGLPSSHIATANERTNLKILDLMTS